MRKVIVDEFMTLDGVVQGPGYVDEDTSGGFKQGGWHMPHLDERAMKWITDGIASAGGFLFGRRTYEIFAAYWPNAGLVDEIRIMLDPVTVGGGKRLFRDDGTRRSLKLVDSQVTSKGAILTTYAVAAESTPPSRETMRDVIAR
jgi:dihydrofolate reductase